MRNDANGAKNEKNHVQTAKVHGLSIKEAAITEHTGYVEEHHGVTEQHDGRHDRAHSADDVASKQEVCDNEHEEEQSVRQGANRVVSRVEEAPHHVQHGIGGEGGGPNSSLFLLFLDAFRHQRNRFFRNTDPFVHSEKTVEKWNQILVENGVQGDLNEDGREEEERGEKTTFRNHDKHPNGNGILQENEEQAKAQQPERVRSALRFLHRDRHRQYGLRDDVLHQSRCASQQVKSLHVSAKSECNELKGIQKDEGLQHQREHDHHVGRKQVVEEDDQGERKGRGEKIDEWEEVVAGTKKGRKKENEEERETQEREI